MPAFHYLVAVSSVTRRATSALPRLEPRVRPRLRSKNGAARAAVLLASLVTCLPSAVHAQDVAPTTIQQPNADRRRLSPDQIREVAPALEQFTQQHLYGEVWKRPGLSPRDRSMVVVAAMIARGEAPALTYYANQAIENGVKPAEISETITHLAFYTGWGRAMAAVGPVRDVFAARHVRPEDLPPAFGALQPLDPAKDAVRASGVSNQFGTVSPGTVAYTNGLLFKELWQRPYLSQRDRSLVTISALIAGGQAEQLPYHLNRGMDQGLTQGQVGEVLTQLAFYAGWPSVFAAMPIARQVFEQRAGKSAGK